MQLGDRTLIMGVINLTPDSFSDGGRFNDPDRAYARALELEEAGADIIDIGAESTRPGSPRISADEEWQRLVPVLKRLRGNLRVPLSLDTYKSEIAERALQYGVEILNDPSGLTYDPGLAKVAANGNAGLILNHMRGTPDTWSKLPPMQDPLGGIARELEATINRARQSGVDRARIVIDPGLGFGKRKEQNSEVLGRLAELAGLDYPILVGASRKSFLAQSTEADTAFATAAAVAVAVLNGAHMVRVHDVKAMHSVILVADEIVRAVAAGTRVVEAEERPASRMQKERPFEAEKPRAFRPPLAKPAVIEAVVIATAVVAADADELAAEQMAALDGMEEAAGLPVDIQAADAAERDMSESVEAKEGPPAVRPIFREKPKDESRGETHKDGHKDEPRTPFRTPGKFSEDRDAVREGGFRPPARPAFRPDSRPSDDRRPQAGGPPPRRDRDFRPGGPGQDRPNRPFDRDRNAPQGDRPSFSRPGGDRPAFNRPSGDRPSFSRPGGDRPAFNRPGGDRPSFSRPGGDRPAFNRPSGDRPSYGRPGGDRPSFDRPRGDRPQGDRPSFSRPGGDRPSFDRPSFDRPRGDRPQGDRPSFDRPQGDRRPPSGAPPRRDFRPGGPPSGGPPRGGGDRFRPGGPPRSSDRTDSRPPFRGDRPGGDRPGSGPNRSGPPSRPFRKRP